MAPKEENESKEQIDRLLDFRDMLTKMCPFLKALQASGSTVVAVTDFLAEVEEAGGSWYLFFSKKVFIKNWETLMDCSIHITYLKLVWFLPSVG